MSPLGTSPLRFEPIVVTFIFNHNLFTKVNTSQYSYSWLLRHEPDTHTQTHTVPVISPLNLYINKRNINQFSESLPNYIKKTTIYFIMSINVKSQKGEIFIMMKRKVKRNHKRPKWVILTKLQHLYGEKLMIFKLKSKMKQKAKSYTCLHLSVYDIKSIKSWHISDFS